jgi:hypothetical protein
MREQTLAFVPPEYGVLCIHEAEHQYQGRVTRERLPKPNRAAIAWPPQKRFELARNGLIKYWHQAMQVKA